MRLCSFCERPIEKLHRKGSVYVDIGEKRSCVSFCLCALCYTMGQMFPSEKMAQETRVGIRHAGKAAGF